MPHIVQPVVYLGEVLYVPEIRATPKGEYSAYMQISSIRVGHSAAAKQTKTYHIVATGDQAIAIRNTVRRGDTVQVAGELVTVFREEKGTGRKRYFKQLMASEVQTLPAIQTYLPLSA